MDILNKCYTFKRNDTIESLEILPFFQAIESAQDTTVRIKGKNYLMMGSNNYLGLANDPEVKMAAIEATIKYGTGSTGSRYLNGNLDIHNKLEKELSDFFGKEAAFLFGTGYQTNVGILGTLVGKNDYIILDRANHASIYDAARFSYGQIVKYKHNDMHDLERVLKHISKENPNYGKLIVVDGVFSMEGDIVNLPDIVEIAKKYKARIMVDDAHGAGVLGKKGKGTASHFNLADEVDIIMVTFSKSFATLGGAVMASEEVIHYLRYFARPAIFSAGLTAGSAGTVLKVLEILKSPRGDRLLNQLWKVTREIAQTCLSLGYNIGTTQTPIIPIYIGKSSDCFEAWKIFRENGFFVNPVIPPAIPEGFSLLRTSYMASHTDENIEQIKDILKLLRKQLKF